MSHRVTPPIVQQCNIQLLYHKLPFEPLPTINTRSEFGCAPADCSNVNSDFESSMMMNPRILVIQTVTLKGYHYGE